MGCGVVCVCGTGDASGKDKKAKKKLKDEEDPDFLRAVDEIVDGMEIKGSYRKPSWDDVLAYRLVLLPYTLGRFIWFNAQWYYKHRSVGFVVRRERGGGCGLSWGQRYSLSSACCASPSWSPPTAWSWSPWCCCLNSYQKLPLSEEEEQYLAVRAVGQTVWEASTPEEQAEMTKARVWEGDNWEQYKVRGEGGTTVISGLHGVKADGEWTVFAGLVCGAASEDRGGAEEAAGAAQEVPPVPEKGGRQRAG